MTVNFPGFADLLRVPALPQAGPAVPSLAQPRPIPDDLLPPMTLEAFCVQYKLSFTLQEKLMMIDITGPHILTLVSDRDLREGGGLSIGELAALRDAQMQWKRAAQDAL